VAQEGKEFVTHTRVNHSTPQLLCYTIARSRTVDSTRTTNAWDLHAVAELAGLGDGVGVVLIVSFELTSMKVPETGSPNPTELAKLVMLKRARGLVAFTLD